MEIVLLFCSLDFFFNVRIVTIEWAFRKEYSVYLLFIPRPSALPSDQIVIVCYKKKKSLLSSVFFSGVRAEKNKPFRRTESRKRAQELSRIWTAAELP